MDTSTDAGPAAILEEWRKVERAATPGPLEAVTDDHGRGRLDHSVWSGRAGYYLAETVRTRDDAEFIVTARTAMPRLVAAVDAALKLADDWDAESDHLDDLAERSDGDEEGRPVMAGQAIAYHDAAVDLREAVTAALAGKEE